MDIQQMRIRMGEMAAEIERLNAEREQFLAQTPDAYVPVHARTGEYLWANTVTSLDQDHPSSYKMAPVYLHSSPAVAVPDDRLRQIAALMAEAYKRHAQLRKDARDRGDVVGDKAANHSESCMKMALQLFESTQHIHGFGSPDLALTAVPVAISTSPRITEQDAIDLRRYRWLRDSDNFPMDDIPDDSIWDHLCEKDRADFDEFIDLMMGSEDAGAAELLAKLNDKPESAGG